MEKNCLVCGIPLKGRLDKIFCNDHCRSFYHNHKNKNNLALIQKTNRILKRNWQILESVQSADFDELEVSMIIKMGFTPNYHTQIRRSPKGNWYFFVYDLGFELIENGRKIKLLKIELLNFQK